MANNTEIPYGYCHCGCGQKTTICHKTNSRQGHIKGVPHLYIKGHYSFRYKGDKHTQWKGGIHLNAYGYRCLYKPGHHRAINNRVFEHILVVEEVLGKPMPRGTVVHHINGVANDNQHSNLVLCQDEAYHRLIHKRMRALDACGHPNWLRCWICKLHDDPKYLEIKPHSKYYHRECINHYHKIKREQSNG